MTVIEYMTKVIDLFRSGRAEQVHWDEMANAVQRMSENWGETPNIDEAIGFDPDKEE